MALWHCMTFLVLSPYDTLWHIIFVVNCLMTLYDTCWFHRRKLFVTPYDTLWHAPSSALCRNLCCIPQKCERVIPCHTVSPPSWTGGWACHSVSFEIQPFGINWGVTVLIFRWSWKLFGTKTSQNSSYNIRFTFNLPYLQPFPSKELAKGKGKAGGLNGALA